MDLGGKGRPGQVLVRQSAPVLILVLVDLGGKDLYGLGSFFISCLNPCFGGFGWERMRSSTFSPISSCLNPCFGGFGWESPEHLAIQVIASGLNPCFGGFGWESCEILQLANAMAS